MGYLQRIAVLGVKIADEARGRLEALRLLLLRHARRDLYVYLRLEKLLIRASVGARCIAVCALMSTG